MFKNISKILLLIFVILLSFSVWDSVSAETVTASSIGLQNSQSVGTPTSVWIANTSTSGWVVFGTGNAICYTTHTYTSTFVMTKKVGVTITGRFAVDDALTSTIVNGTYNANIKGGGHAAWTSFTMTIPASAINIGTNNIVFTAKDTACHITGFRVEFDNQVTLEEINCNTSSDCGTSGYTGSAFCSGGDVYKTYKTYTCNNAGTTSSYCSNSTQDKLYTDCTSTQTCSGGTCSDQDIACDSSSDCGTSGYIGSAFCSGGDVYKTYRTYKCNNAGTTSAYCSNTSEDKLYTNCSSNQTCSNGSCSDQDIACDSSSDCGTSGYIGSAFCSGGDVYKTYRTYTCSNAGTTSSYCSNSTSDKLYIDCGSSTCSNGSCSSNNCTDRSYQQCSGNYLYWYDSCGNQDDLIQYCSNGCYNNSCNNNSCTNHSYQRCVGNYLYWYDSCGNQDGLAQYCSNGCSGNSCQNSTCTYHSYQQCSGNYLYWYDSCGSQQDVAEYCTNGCSNGSCSGSNYYGNCNYHAYRLCIGSSVYWYDSCGSQQDLYQNCASSGLTCSYGQCASQQTKYYVYYKKACYKNSVRWYDSLGAISGLYQNCADSNSCTLDSCAGAKCSNILKCDGSTCTAGSEDYNKYCGFASCGNGNCEQNLGETESTCSADCKTNIISQNLAVSLFAKKDSTSLQWDKNIQLGQNETVYFMVTLNNNSNSQIDNIAVSVNIPSEISYLGNLKIDDVAISGDIVSGINIGSVQAMGRKTITFEGKTQTFAIQEQKQAVANIINSAEFNQSDSISINFDASQTSSASISSSPASTGILEFLKHWFMWIIVALVLVFLFVVVFRRISSDT